LADNTLVIFSSDNGGVVKPQLTNTLQAAAFRAGLRINGDLHGGKHDVWEGGFKVPFIVRWPGKAAPGTVSREMISLADILATTAAIVGEPLPPANVAAEDSHNILPAILGESPKPLRDSMIVHSADGVFAIRQGPWKWIEGIPVEETAPGARRIRADQYHAQLYNVQDDPPETKDVSTAHPDIANQLHALLNRYRDGGYSRELPPVTVKAKLAIADLPAITGDAILAADFSQMPAAPWNAMRGEWIAKDGGLWGVQKARDEQGATLHVPMSFTDGTMQFEINFKGANRHSCRFECAGGHSFRIEIARSYLAFTKNPSRGEGKEQTEPLARKALALEAGQWYPVRFTFKGNEATAQVNDTAIKGSHASIGAAKTGFNLLVFGETAGFRNLKVAK